MEKTRMHRKLIRPNLAEYKDKMSREATKRKSNPPYETYAENYYYLKQMNKKTLMSVVFLDGETVKGYIEWYDRDCFKLNRESGPNLLVYKKGIKYLSKFDTKKTVKEPKKNSESTKTTVK